MVFKMSKKGHFLQFCAELSKKPKLKQYTYMHVKVFITLLQKMVQFIGVWATIHELLAIKILRTMLTQQKFNKIRDFKP